MRHLFLTSAIAVFAFGLSFVSGYVYGRSDGTARTGFVAAVLAPLDNLATVTAPPSDGQLDEQERRQFNVFWEAWSIVERDYYNRPAIDHQKMIYGAIKGMVDAVGDPYTAYATPANRELIDTDLRGSFDGVGIQVDMRDAKLTVVSPIEGSPADQAGIKPGDIITHVDDKPLNAKTLSDTVLLIRGLRGTVVTLRISRPGAERPLSFTMTRAEIKLESVKTRALADGVGYIRISAFAQNTGAQTASSLKDLIEQSPRGIVIDLRSNPGGYLHSAVDVASQFMPAGQTVLLQANGNGDRQSYETKPGGVATETKLAILVNKGTASASEIVAAALRDNGRAVIIGEKTFGKGTVQNVHVLSDKSGLRVTTAQWLTPKEQPLQGVGLDPDLLAIAPESPAAGDQQLDVAVRYLVGG